MDPMITHAPRYAGGTSRTSAKPDRVVTENTWQVRLMGMLSVSRYGRRWDGVRVGSRRARMLLSLLALDAGRLITVDRIVEALWPTGAPRRPAANVATLVSRLRSTFDADLIIGGWQGYRLGEQVGNDLTAAVDLVAVAEADLVAERTGSARAAADRALGLMHDEVLPELADESWVVPARALRSRLRRRAWHVSAAAALRSREPRGALAIAEAAMSSEPLDEAACRLAMQAWDDLNEPAAALLAYNRLRKALARDLGVEPAEPTQHIYLSILRGRSGSGRQGRGVGCR